MTTLQKLEIRKRLEPLFEAAGFKQDRFGSWKQTNGVNIYCFRMNDNVIRYEKSVKYSEGGTGWIRLKSYGYGMTAEIEKYLSAKADERKAAVSASVEAMNRMPVTNKIPIGDTVNASLFDAMEFGFRQHEKGNNLEFARQELARALGLKEVQ